MVNYGWIIIYANVLLKCGSQILYNFGIVFREHCSEVQQLLMIDWLRICKYKFEPNGVELRARVSGMRRYMRSVVVINWAMCMRAA